MDKREEEVSDMRADLGRATWPYYFKVAWYLPPDSESQMRAWEHIYEGLKGVYPCRSCGTHGAQWMDMNPFDPETEDLYHYVCRLKTVVDIHMGKTPRECPPAQPGKAHTKICLPCESEWDDLMASMVPVGTLGQPPKDASHEVVHATREGITADDFTTFFESLETHQHK